jgi:DNA-binding response OmpR family regulator
VTTHGHVLVVEDNELVTGALRVLLESAELQVSVAETIAEALATPPLSAQSLVLLDLRLPDGDGLTLVEPLRAMGWQKIVCLTGRDDPATRQRALDAGCIDVLIKPVPARELVAKSSAWLG